MVDWNTAFFSGLVATPRPFPSLFFTEDGVCLLFHYDTPLQLINEAPPTMGAVDVAEVAETPRSTNDELEAVLPKDGTPWYRKSYLIKTNICVISLMLFSGSNGFDGSLMNGLLALP